MRKEFTPAARSGFTSSYKQMEEVIEYEKAIKDKEIPDKLLVELYEVKTGKEYHIFDYDADTGIMKCLINPLDIKEELVLRDYPLKELDRLEFIFVKSKKHASLKTYIDLFESIRYTAKQDEERKAREKEKKKVCLDWL